MQLKPRFSIRVLFALLVVAAVAALGVRAYLQAPPYFLASSSTQFAVVRRGEGEDYSERAAAIRMELIAWNRQQGESPIHLNLIFIGGAHVRIEQKLREISSSVEEWQRMIELEISQFEDDGKLTPFATASLLVDLKKQSVSLEDNFLDLNSDSIYLLRLDGEKHLDLSVTDAKLEIPGVPEELLEDLRLEVAKFGL